ncbi:MAG: CHAT domain-containing protein [Chitinophagales bacterium]|nr:CHAT domain-containing protein [Chitinophagales bacterium]
MYNFLFPKIDYSILHVFLMFFFIPMQMGCQPSLANNSIPLEEVEAKIVEWFKNTNLSWEEVDDKLETLGEQLVRQKGELSYANALLLHKRGVVYFKLRDYKTAIVFYQKALSLRKQLYVKTHHRELLPDIIRGHSNITGCYQYRKRPFEAIRSSQSAQAFINQYEPFEDIAKIVQQLQIYTARAYHSIGDLDNALNSYLAVRDIEIQKRYYDKDQKAIKMNTVRALTEVGGLLANELGQVNQGLLYLWEAEQILQNISKPNSDLLPELHHSLGVALMRKEDLVSAEWHLQQAIQLNQDLRRNRALVRNFNNLGIVQKLMKDYESAKQSLERARVIVIDSLQSREYLDLIYDNMGDVAYLQGNLRYSLVLDNKALTFFFPEFDPSRHTNPNLNQQLTNYRRGMEVSLSSLAATQSKLYNTPDSLKLALETYTLAIQLIDSIRQDFRPDASKESLVDRTKPIYEEAIELCWRLYDMTGEEQFLASAFNFSEGSRGIILYEAITNLHADFNLPEEIAASVRDLRLALHYHEGQLALALQSGNENAARIGELRSTVTAFRRQWDEMRDMLIHSYPAYNRYLSQATILGIEHIQNDLDVNTSVLEYFVGEHAIYAFVINKNERAAFYRWERPKELTVWVNDINHHIQNPTSEFFLPAYKLYELLFRPLENKLKERISLVPDDILGYISFDMLPLKMPDESPHINYLKFYQFETPYLISKYQINYQYSISLSQETHEGNSDYDLSFVGIAPEFSNSIQIHGIHLGALSGNKALVSNLAETYKPDALNLYENIKDSFTDNTGNCQILQLATHAVANDTSGELSFILLGPTSEDLLYAKELYGMSIPAELVILSSCQGAKGELNRGEGVISLARGFFYAGSQSVVPTLWSVKEDPTNQITGLFHRFLAKGMSKDEALRQAKLKFLDSITAANGEFAHPYFWASFIPIGNMKPLSAYQNKKSRDYLAGISFLSFMIIAWWFVRRRKRQYSLQNPN